MPETKDTVTKGGLLDEFIDSLGVIASAIAENAMRFASDGGDPEEVHLVRSFSVPLIETMTQTGNLLRTTQQAASANERQSAESMLRTMGSSALVAQTKSLAQSIKGFIGKLGLIQIIQLIKKLIRWLFDLFNIHIRWLDKLIDLIDEILNALLGGGNAKYAHAFSVREQDYFGELTALANYEAARARLRDSADSEEEL